MWERGAKNICSVSASPKGNILKKTTIWFRSSMNGDDDNSLSRPKKSKELLIIPGCKKGDRSFDKTTILEDDDLSKTLDMDDDDQSDSTSTSIYDTPECNIEKMTDKRAIPFSDTTNHCALKPFAPNHEKAVRFSTITIQEYPIIVGDHPCVSSGTPITIGWEVLSFQTYGIDKYEHYVHNDPTRQLWASVCQSPHCISAIRRERLLSSLGFTKTEQRQGRKSAESTRKQRRCTRRYMYLSAFEERIIESSWFFGQR